MDKKSPECQTSSNRQPRGEVQIIHKYAWARAAEAGAVSALRTASSSVEATNRTLWTFEEDWFDQQHRSNVQQTHTSEGPLVAIDWMGILYDDHLIFYVKRVSDKNLPVQNGQEFARDGLSILGHVLLINSPM